MNEAKCQTKQIIYCGPQNRFRIEIDLETGAYDMQMALGGGYLTRPNGVPFEIARVECSKEKDPPFTSIARFILAGAVEILELAISDPDIRLRVLPKISQ